MAQNNNSGSDNELKVLSFLSRQLSVSLSSLNPSLSLFHDLGVDGDDTLKLLQQFSKEFNVKLSNFEFTSYFGNEAGFSPFAYILRLIKTGGLQEAKKPLTVFDMINAVTVGELK